MAKKKDCPKPLDCPTPMAVASRMGQQAQTCEGKRKALDLWVEAASAEVAKHPGKSKFIDRTFDKKSAAVERWCSSQTAAARAEAAKIERERAAIVGSQAMDGLFGYGRRRRRGRR